MMNRRQRRKEQEKLEVEYERLVLRKKGIERIMNHPDVIDDKEFQEERFKELTDVLLKIDAVKKAHDKLNNDGVVNKAQAENVILRAKMGQVIGRKK